MTPREIFEKDQVLTLEIARTLIGKKIACTSPEYKANSCHVSEFVVGGFISEWEFAATREYPKVDTSKYVQYSNYQEYWKSYMKSEQKLEHQRRLLLIDADGNRQYVCYLVGGCFGDTPTFFGSDADREVYYVEILKPNVTR